MQIWKPRYSPKQHPFGAMEDTGAGLDAVKGRWTIQGRYRTFAHVGFQNILALKESFDFGESWANIGGTFPTDHLLDISDVNAKYLGDYWLSTSNTQQNKLVTYKSSDGLNWTQQYEINLNEGAIGQGDPNYRTEVRTVRVFPLDSGIYQAAHAWRVHIPTGDVIHNKLILIKDGQIIDNQNKPVFNSNPDGIENSTFDPLYEKGFFAMPTSDSGGMDEIWRIDRNGFSMRGSIPFEPNNRRAERMFYLPKFDALFINSGRPYRMFDDGSGLSELSSEEANFMQISTTSTGLDAIYNDVNIKRSKALGDDIPGNTFEYGSIISQLGGNNEFVYSLPFKLNRRQSKHLYEIDDFIPPI